MKIVLVRKLFSCSCLFVDRVWIGLREEGMGGAGDMGGGLSMPILHYFLWELLGSDMIILPVSWLHHVFSPTIEPISTLWMVTVIKTHTSF